MSNKTYQVLAKAAGAFHRCEASGNNEWQCKWEQTMLDIVKEHFPHGSGFDNGTKIDIQQSNDDKLVFTTAFHHMDQNGMYDGWTEHQVIVTPSLGLDFHVKVTGRDKYDVKSYITECFSQSLSDEVKENHAGVTVS